ncbi:MAG: DUF2065 domain-containing protein [Rhodobacteraceae bacterium]|nr:DUF2065 domain-containing protein [Paracoccaceae bacterium]
MSEILLALGLVLAVEGLVLALAPRRIEDALRLLASLGLDQRRAIGIGALAFGVALVWLARTG